MQLGLFNFLIHNLELYLGVGDFLYSWWVCVFLNLLSKIQLQDGPSIDLEKL
jgi:hypothetical protein